MIEDLVDELLGLMLDGLRLGILEELLVVGVEMMDHVFIFIFILLY